MEALTNNEPAEELTDDATHASVEAAMRQVGRATIETMGDAHPEERAAASKILRKLPRVHLASLTADLILHVHPTDICIATDTLVLLASLSPEDVPPYASAALLRKLQATDRAVQRVAILAPAPLPLWALARLEPDAPLSAPPLLLDGPPSPPMPPADTLTATFEFALLHLGADAMQLALLHKLPFHTIRALACTDSTTRSLVARYMRTSQHLSLSAATDATWANAAYLARLPHLRSLRVGSAVYDLPTLRGTCIELRSLSVATATLLGGVLGRFVSEVRLAVGTLVSVASWRTSTTLTATTRLPLKEVDAAFLQGVLRCNPHLQPDDVRDALDRTVALCRNINTRTSMRSHPPPVQALVNALAAQAVAQAGPGNGP